MLSCLLALALAARMAPGEPACGPDQAVDAAAALVSEIVDRSYPDLRGLRLRVDRFHSESDYFRTSIALGRYLTGRPMEYVVLVNPDWVAREAPIDGVRAILAHELAHVADLARGNRLRLFGLVGLASPVHTARFERHADLEAIARQYGPGLAHYRTWLYAHVPAGQVAEKRRNYLSPAEIDAIVAACERRPELLTAWLKRPPMSLLDIQTQSGQ